MLEAKSVKGDFNQNWKTFFLKENDKILRSKDKNAIKG